MRRWNEQSYDTWRCCVRSRSTNRRIISSRRRKTLYRDCQCGTVWMPLSLSTNSINRSRKGAKGSRP
jgi:hypothetical protein